MKFNYQIIRALTLMVTFVFLLSGSMTAQKKSDEGKFNAKSEKAATKEIKSKAVKEARKAAKKLAKQGYKVNPGSMPLAKQLERSWMKQYQEDEDGNEKYLVSDGNGVGKTLTAAELQAMEAAKLQLAGQISNEITQIIEAKIANDQIDRETGNSLTKFVAGSKNYVVQSLPYVKPYFKAYRDSGDRDVEVTIKLFYSAAEALEASRQAAEKAIRDELEDEADVLIDEINNIYNER